MNLFGSAGLPGLSATAAALTADGRGILAMDESIGTCNRRFEARGIAATPELRRDYRELLLTAPSLSAHIAGVILCDETFMEDRADGGAMLDAALQGGLLVGIKVDAGAKPMALHPGETVTEGLDGLRERLALYRKRGASFAKWRAVLRVDEATPSRGCLAANALGLARYAGLCQEAGLLPIVEPELLMDGDHDLRRCYWATEMALHAVFAALYAQRVDLGGLLLKPNMVLPGAASGERPSARDVADASIQCLLASVPAAVPGIAFLSGGQSPEMAALHLKTMNDGRHGKLPWRLTFSFARAIQEPVLARWMGRRERRDEAQAILLERAAACASAAKACP